MQIRSIYTSFNLGKSQVGRFMNKVLQSDTTKKSRHKNKNPHTETPETFTATSKKDTTHVDRRVRVLNKIFMKHITDLMATGEVAPILLGRGIEISHVKVAPDFRIINVFWFSNEESDSNENTELILKKSAGHLQHELTQLRVIGKVPRIQFVKNKKYSLIKEVESRLSKVDFGEDFVPSTYITRNSLPMLETTLSSKEKEQIASLNSVSEVEENLENEFEIQLPEMRHDILGFDHSKIMKKIKVSLDQSKISQKNKILNIQVSESVESQASPSDIAEFLSKKEETKLFDDFLKQRLIDEKRRQKARPLKESKLEDETEWYNMMNNDNIEDTPIIEENRNEYEDVENYRL